MGIRISNFGKTNIGRTCLITKEIGFSYTKFVDIGFIFPLPTGITRAVTGM